MPLGAPVRAGVGGGSVATAVVSLVVLAIVAIAVAHVVAAYVLAHRMTRIRRLRVTGSPADVHMDFEDVTFASADGPALRGWYLESPDARASVVIVHGDGATRSDPAIGMLELQRDYARGGLNVLAFDLRGRGESGGQRNQLGAGELADVLGAVRYAQHRSETPVVLHGFSTGASLALTAATRTDQVAAVVADSPVASMRAHIRDRHKGVPAHLFALATRLARWRFDADIDAVTPARSMHELGDTTVMFVHCENDRDVPMEHTLNLAAASLNEANEVWTPYEGGHCATYRHGPGEYMHRCLRFIDQAIPSRVQASRAV